MKMEAYFLENVNEIITFESTEPELHTIRTALGSVFQKTHYNQDNTPPMPLFDAHLGGFFFLGL